MDTTMRGRGILALALVALLAGALLPTVGADAARALIGTNDLRNGAVTNAKVRPGSLRYTAFRRGEVARATLAGIPAKGVLRGTFPAPRLATGSVTADAIATGAVGSAELGAGAVRTVDIANGSIGAAKIAPNSIGKGQIAPGGVGASEIAPGAVGTSELAPLPGALGAPPTPLQIPNNVAVLVPLHANRYSTGDVWSPARPDRLVAPVAGVYLATATAQFDGANTGGARALTIVRNADVADVVAGEELSATTIPGTPTLLNATALVRLDAGESVALAVLQTSGSTITLPAEGTTLGLQFMSR